MRTIDLTNLSAEETRRMNSIADDIKSSYTSFVDDCCRKYGDETLYWDTPFVSRNVYNDNTFFRICKILLVQHYVNEGKEDLRVITDNMGEYKALKGSLPSTVDIILRKRGITPRPVRQIRTRWRALINYTWRQIQYYLYTHKSVLDYENYKTIVISPILSSDFEGLNYYDRYLTGIDKYEDVLYLPQLINNSGISEKEFVYKLNSCLNCHFIFEKELIHILDVFDILNYWRFLDKLKNYDYCFNGIDITPIICESMEEGKICPPAIDGLFTRRVLERLKKKRVSIERFILWYEGRPCDVYNATSIREYFPESKCVGYEGKPLVESQLSLYISKYQFQSGHCPSLMTVPGKAYESDAHQFCKDIPLKYVPILRSNYKILENKARLEGVCRILVLLSYFVDVSSELLRNVNQYVKQSKTSCVVFVKNHPAYRDKRVEDYIKDPVGFEPVYLSGKLEDCLTDIDIVVGSMTSATLEVVFARVPMVIHCPSGQIGYTALPKTIRSSLCKLVFSINDLREALDSYMNINSMDYSALSDLLIPKTEENIRELLS